MKTRGGKESSSAALTENHDSRPEKSVTGQQGACSRHPGVPGCCKLQPITEPEGLQGQRFGDNNQATNVIARLRPSPAHDAAPLGQKSPWENEYPVPQNVGNTSGGIRLAQRFPAPCRCLDP